MIGGWPPSTCCESSPPPTGRSATRSACSWMGRRSPAADAKGSPATSASPRPCSSTTTSGRRCGSSRPRWRCRSRATRPSGPRGCCARSAARLRCCARRPASSRVGYEGDIIWIAARPEWAPPFEYVELANAAEVDSLDRAPGGEGWAYCWAWEDEEAGPGQSPLVRCRMPGSPRTRRPVRRPLRSADGSGGRSRSARAAAQSSSPAPWTTASSEVGGRVVLDEARDYPMPPLEVESR